MARSAIPDFGIEYPEYKYDPWPRQVGLDAHGEQIVANDQKEYDELLPTVVFPKIMGKDKAGKDVIAYIPRDLSWKKDQVVTPPEDPAVVKQREADRLAAEAETKRKAEAYDKMMAAQDAKKEPAADAGTAAGSNLLDQPAKTTAKSKAA